VAGISNAAASVGNQTKTLSIQLSAINVTYVPQSTANGCTNPNNYNVVVTVNRSFDHDQSF
jgi:hypothetical protein